MSRQTWIAKRRIIPPEPNVEMNFGQWPGTLVIPVMGERQRCRVQKTAWPGLVVVDLGSANWTVSLTESYTITHEQSRLKIARFDFYADIEPFLSDPDVQALFRKIPWVKDANTVIAAMKPYLSLFNDLRDRHGCKPTAGTAS